MNNITFQNEICCINLDNKPHNYLEFPEFISTKALSDIISANKCKTIVITGAGRHFSAGAELNNLFEMAKNGSLKTEIEKGKNLLSAIRNFNIPIIACIEGACFGGGLEIALQADIKIASKKALLAFPESNMGLIPGLGGIINLTKITGGAKAIELVIKGEIFDAETALGLNIIDYLAEPKTTFEKGLELAKSITENREIEVIKAVVEAVRNANNLPYEKAIERETELFCKLAKLAVT